MSGGVSGGLGVAVPIHGAVPDPHYRVRAGTAPEGVELSVLPRGESVEP